MNVLVTGGAGYVGSHVTQLLSQNGHQVKVLDSMLFPNCTHPQTIDSEFDLIEGDVRSAGDLARAINGVDAIIHLAGIVGDPACRSDRTATYTANVESTRIVKSLAEHYGVDRLIFASTCSVYGRSSLQLNEGASVNPLSKYAESKVIAEEILTADLPRTSRNEFDLQSCRDDGLAVTILRLGTIFGWSRRMRFDLVLNYLTANAVLENDVPIYGHGKQFRPFVHVQDAARAFVACLEANRHDIYGECFNVGSNDMNFRMKEIGEQIADVVPNATARYVTEKEDDRSYRVDFSKIDHELGWTTEHTLRDGISEIAENVRTSDISASNRDRFSNSSYQYS